jgi:hypothetical protein
MGFFSQNRWSSGYLHRRWSPRYRSYKNTSPDNKEVKYVLLEDIDERYRTPLDKWSIGNVRIFSKRVKYIKDILIKEEIKYFVHPNILEKWLNLHRTKI